MSNFCTERRQHVLEELRQCIIEMRASPKELLSEVEQFIGLAGVINENGVEEGSYFEYFEQDIYDTVANTLSKLGVSVETFRGELFPFPLYILRWKDNTQVNIFEGIKLLASEYDSESNDTCFIVNNDSLEEVLITVSDAKLGAFMKQMISIIEPEPDNRLYHCAVKVLNLILDFDSQSVSAEKHHLEKCSVVFIGSKIKSLARELFAL